jgi:hypothetical protein
VVLLQYLVSFCPESFFIFTLEGRSREDSRIDTFTEIVDQVSSAIPYMSLISYNVGEVGIVYYKGMDLLLISFLCRLVCDCCWVAYLMAHPVLMQRKNAMNIVMVYKFNYTDGSTSVSSDKPDSERLKILTFFVKLARGPDWKIQLSTCGSRYASFSQLG